MAKISLKLRVDSLDNWNEVQNDSNGPFGYVRKGELVAGIDISTGKIIIRLGSNSSPVLFNECPVVFESSLEYTQENTQYVILNSIPSENSFLVFENGSFSLKLISDFVGEIQYPENYISIPIEDRQETGFIYFSQEKNKWYNLSQFFSSLNFVTVPIIINGGKANEFVLSEETANDINPNRTITIKNKILVDDVIFLAIDEEIILKDSTD